MLKYYQSLNFLTQKQTLTWSQQMVGPVHRAVVNEGSNWTSCLSDVPVPWTAAVTDLHQICQYLGDLRAHLTSLQKESELQNQWCHVGYVLDFLLFRIYLLLISCYAMVIISMWCIWISQTWTRNQMMSFHSGAKQQSFYNYTLFFIIVVQWVCLFMYNNYNMFCVLIICLYFVNSLKIKFSKQ